MTNKKMTLFLIWLLCSTLSSFIALRGAEKKSNEDYEDKKLYITMAVIGGTFAALGLDHFRKNQTTSLSTILVSLLGTITLGVSTVYLLMPRIKALSSKKIVQSLVAFKVSTLSSFFIFFLLNAVVGSLRGTLDSTTQESLNFFLKSSFLPALVISLLLNAIGFAFAFYFKTDKLTDSSYALTFGSISLFLYGLQWFRHQNFDKKDMIVLGVILLWGFRLGAFLLKRIIKDGKDKRFDNMRDSFVKFGAFWLLQAFSVPMILLPGIAFLTRNIRKAPKYAIAPFLFGIGIAISLMGLLIEHIADQEKYAFKQDPANKGKWIATGIWKYSRHPNYFGEMLVWVGLFVAVASYLPPEVAIIAALGPTYIVALITFLSGIPLLEQRADARWKDNQAYQGYKQRTSVLVPWFTH